MQRDKNIKIRLTTSLFVAMLFVSALFVRCANIGTPEGGPLDSLPPTILNMEPMNYSKNMDTLTRRIYIEFDEFVQLVNQQSEFFTSPQMKNKPQLHLKGRGVVVTLRDTLKPNTTYALNFGSSIQDNNENNPLYSMRYVFSTGDEVDSLIMSGYAEDSYKVDSVGGAYILFYPKDSIEMNPLYDSTVFNATPTVIARSEKNGIFMAQNLKPIPYYIYALEDTNGNLTYEPGTDRIGFVSETYNPAEMGEFMIWYDSIRKYVVAEPQIHFRMFMDEPFKRQLLAESSRPLQHKAILNFGANHPKIDSLIFDSIPSDRIMLEYPTIGRDTITVWFNMPSEQLPDTIRGRIVYHKHDSLNVITPTSEPLRLTWKYYESKEERQAREKREKARKRSENRRDPEKGRETVEERDPEENEENEESDPEENEAKAEEKEEKKEEKKEEEKKVAIKIGSGAEVNPENSITFDFDFPLSMVDSSAIRLTRLTVEEQKMLETQKKLIEEADKLAAAKRALEQTSDTTATTATTATTKRAEYYGEPYPFTFRRDTQNLRRWHFETKWSDPGDSYYLTLPAGSIRDITGLSNDSITKTFTPLKKEEFSVIILNILEDKEQPSHYIVELMDASGKSVKERRTGVTHGKTVLNYISAGTYSLRILQDINNNGKWDSGDLIKRQQSERSQVYRTSKGEQEFETKVNWEIEIDIDPAKLFAPESQSELVERLAREEKYRLDAIEKKRLEEAEKRR